MAYRLLLAVLLALPIPGRADAPAETEADGDSDWTLFEPPAPPPGGGPAPTTPEGGYSNPDRVTFDEKLRERVLDQVCRFLRIQQDFDLYKDGITGASTGLTRRLMHNPLSNRLDLVDEQRLRLSAGKGWSEAAGEGGPSAGFHVGATISGRSVVVRRLQSAQTCKEIDEVLDLREIKTVVPFKARRIQEMAVGELWRVPFTLTVGYGASLSEALGENAQAAISFGYSKGGSASMTIYRLSEKELRFRFRIDYAVVRSRGLHVSKTVPAADFLLGWGGLLKHVDKALSKEMGKILHAQLGFSRANTDGQRMVLEHVADPSDPEQAEAVAEAMSGNFMRLLKAARRVATGHVVADDAAPAYEEIRGIIADELGAPAYAAQESYTHKTRNFFIGIPLAFWHTSSRLSGRSDMTILTGEEGNFVFHPADHSPSSEFLRVPFVGPLVKENNQRRAEAVTYAPRGGTQGEPILVYIRNQGVVRVPASTVGDTVEELNSVLGLVGARRPDEGGGARLTLPIEAVPPPTMTETRHGPRDTIPGTQEASDRKGWLSATLVFNQKAVREAVSAAGTEVLRAFAGSLGPDWRPMMDWLAHNGRLEDGRLVYDWSAAREAFPGERDDDHLRSLSRRAAGLVADLAAAKDAPTNDQRAAALARALSGKGESGMSYEEVLRVLVQFMDPLDVSGDFVENVRCSSDDCANTVVHYVLKKGRADVPLLSEAGATRARFAEPSVLFD